jgi:hypothetical protein
MALKLHALKQGQEHREAKDFADLIFLSRRSNFKSEELREFCVNHGNAKIAEKLLGMMSNG